MTYAILFTNFEVNYTTLKLILFVFNRLPRHQHKIKIQINIPMEKILITNIGRMIIFSNEENFTFSFQIWSLIFLSPIHQSYLPFLFFFFFQIFRLYEFISFVLLKNIFSTTFFFTSVSIHFCSFSLSFYHYFIPKLKFCRRKREKRLL